MSRDGKVAVLMGGPSGEHAISLKSGQGVVEALRRQRWAAEPVVIPQALSVSAACAFVERSLRDLSAEIVFIALHGTFGEDGTIQALCESLHLAYTGSGSAASRLGMHKVAARERFQAAGLAVPRWRLVGAADNAAAAVEQLGYPVVVKPVAEGSSLGVSIARAPDALPEALRSARRYGADVLMEQFIPGREVTVGILDEEPLPVVEIRPKQPFFNFDAKYTAGSTEYLVPAPLPSAVAAAAQAAGVTAHRALGCRHLSRADIILTEDGTPVVLEVNTIPGFTPTSLLPKAAAHVGISYDALCEQLVLMAWHGAALRAYRPVGPEALHA